MTYAASEGTETPGDGRLFLVTGATGKTGSGAVKLLLERGHRTRAMVHREDERSRALAEAGAEVVVSDFLDLDGVTTALRGVDGAYFCYPIRPGLLDATVIFAQAATEAGVRSVVNMSQVSARREALSNGQGLLRLPFGQGRHAPIAAADQSRVIAAVLTDPEPHDRASYQLYGPVEQDHDEIAASMASVLGTRCATSRSPSRSSPWPRSSAECPSTSSST
jgi:NAD(P)H dehydrogenase (quinone)